MAKPYQIKLRRTAQTIDTTSDTWTTPDWWKSAQGDTAPVDGEPIVITDGDTKLLAIGSGNDSKPSFFKSFKSTKLGKFVFWDSGSLQSAGTSVDLKKENGDRLNPRTTANDVYYNGNTSYDNNTIGKAVKDGASTLANKADITYVDDAVSGLRTDVNGLMSTVVKTTNTNQSIAGIKTFTTAPKITATISDSSNDTTVATTKFVQSKIASVNTSISGKQSNITAIGPLKGNGNGSVTAYTGSDPIPVGVGGTGLKQSPSILVNLASGDATNVLTTSPRPGVTGTLPVSKGGTGNTSVDTAPTSGSTKMVTSGGLYTTFSNKLGRTDNVTSANTSYSTSMVRGIKAQTTDPGKDSSLTSGTILLVYEA